MHRYEHDWSASPHLSVSVMCSWVGATSPVVLHGDLLDGFFVYQSYAALIHEQWCTVTIHPLMTLKPHLCVKQVWWLSLRCCDKQAKLCKQRGWVKQLRNASWQRSSTPATNFINTKCVRIEILICDYMTNTNSCFIHQNTVSNMTI